MNVKLSKAGSPTAKTMIAHCNKFWALFLPPRICRRKDKAKALHQEDEAMHHKNVFGYILLRLYEIGKHCENIEPLCGY